MNNNSDGVSVFFKNLFGIQTNEEKELRKTMQNFTDRLNSMPVKKVTIVKDFLKLAMQDDLSAPFLENILHLSDKTVAKVMVPRADMVAVDVDLGLDGISKSIIAHEYTRTLVYKETLDNVVGFIHIKDLFSEIVENKANGDVYKVIRKPIFTAPSMKILDLLSEMRKNRIQIAVVLDEYGGTDGLVTFKDIIEEVFSDIEDEHDFHSVYDVANYKVVDDSTFIVSSRLAIDETENVLGRKLECDIGGCETIGGVILAKAGCIPAIGTVIEISKGIKAEIIDRDARLLKTIKISLSDEGDDQTTAKGITDDKKEENEI